MRWMKNRIGCSGSWSEYVISSCCIALLACFEPGQLAADVENRDARRATEVSAWVAQLGHRSWRVREKAQRALIEDHRSITRQLRTQPRHRDPEVRRRLLAVLEGRGHHLWAARTYRYWTWAPECTTSVHVDTCITCDRLRMEKSVVTSATYFKRLGARGFFRQLESERSRKRRRGN